MTHDPTYTTATWSQDDPTTDSDQFWQEGNGQAMCQLAMTYLLTDDQRYLDRALVFATNSCQYQTWGRKNGSPHDTDNDFSASVQLHGLAVLYDWRYAHLTADQRQTILTALNKRGTEMYKGATGSDPGTVKPAYWQGWWEQNHLWIIESGFATAGIAIYGDPGADNTLPWLQDNVARMNHAMAYTGSDGADFEGQDYWRFSMEWVLRYLDLAKTNLGVDFWNTPWLGRTGSYRLYFSTDANAWLSSADPHSANTLWTSYLDFADDRRTDNAGYIQPKLAAQYRDGVMQWMGGRMDDLGITNDPHDPWLEYLWYDQTVAETSPASVSGLPVFKLFEDMGFTVSRSDWSGNEAVVGYQCGPPMGRTVLLANQTDPYQDWSGEHAHVAANNFCVFGNGEWLIRNDGYADKKITAQSNTLVVDGKGQLGERPAPYYAWFDMSLAAKSSAYIDTNATFSNASMDFVAGDAAGTYPASSGVTKFRRRLIYLRPDVLIVLDSVALSAPKTMELHFFPEQPAANVVGGPAQYTATGNTSVLTFTPLTPSATNTTRDVLPVLNERATDSRAYFKQTPVGNSVSSWDNAVAIAWTAKGSTPRVVTVLTDDPSVWKFRVAGGGRTQTVSVNKTTDVVTLQ